MCSVRDQRHLTKRFNSLPGGRFALGRGLTLVLLLLGLLLGLTLRGLGGGLARLAGDHLLRLLLGLGLLLLQQGLGRAPLGHHEGVVGAADRSGAQ